MYDFGIIGAGPAGYSAAIRAAQLGKRVVLFEKELLGGVCLNKGCIPTKTFLYAADNLNSIKKLTNIGINAENISFDFEKIAENKEKVVSKVRKSLEMLLNSYEIEIVKAEAKIKSKNTIEADEKIYECENIIVATGAKPKSIKNFEFDNEFILNSDDVLNLKSLPQKVLIVGSGAIGVEWARIFSAFGVQVSVVEIFDRLLPLADIEISQRLERTFKQAKIKYYLSTSVAKIIDKKVTLSNEEVLEPDFVLFATGRIINSIPFDNTDEKIKKEISEEIKIVGDAFGSIQLAHFASHQAVNVINKIVLNESKNDFITPSVVYGNPEIAWCGMTQQEIEKENLEYKKSFFPISALGKAASEGNLEGFIKILADKNDKILGAHIISKEASALIHQLSIPMQNGLSTKDLKHCCFAHPTYSEGVYEAILGLDGESLSMLRSPNA